ncbi:MAG: hypothetical protein ACI9R3_001555 [Verrucomicrobiales bacterium]|jgi:hypothetical protein
MKTPSFPLLAALLISAPVSMITASAQDQAAPVATPAPAAVETNEPTPEPKTWVDEYDGLLKKYVTDKGVRYEAWYQSKTDRAELAKVIDAISTQSLGGKGRDERLAFYLNAYNAWILHRILKDYPTDGPGGGGFFGRNRFFKSDDLKVAGKETSFHDLENDIIRPTFNEPRIHFALNCASKSCPPLHTKAFRKETLDTTLTALATAFVNTNSSGVKVTSGGKKVAISKIFDWYEDDFKGGPVKYINGYRKDKLSSKVKVSFQDYYWTLNAVK